MRTSPLLALVGLLISSPAAGRDPVFRDNPEPIVREELEVIGWNDACSVAIQYLGYSRRVGNARPGPVFSRIGTLTLEPGSAAQQLKWFYETDGNYTWKKTVVKATMDGFAKKGYDREGFTERISTPLFDHPSTRVLTSTASLTGRTASGWPPRTYALNRVHYSPLGNCALTVFELKASGEDYFQFLLVRILDAGTRRKRARHHILYARGLLDKGEIDAALIETRTAASIAPESAHARYNYAALLALTGRLKSALKELETTIKKDSSYKKKAVKDIDFEELRRNHRFRFLTTGWKPLPPQY